MLIDRDYMRRRDDAIKSHPKPDPDVLAAKMRRRFDRAFPIDQPRPGPSLSLSWPMWFALVVILLAVLWLL